MVEFAMKALLAVIGLVVICLAARVEAVVVYSGIQDLTAAHESEEHLELSFPGIEQSFLVFDGREAIAMIGGGGVYSTVTDSPGRPVIVSGFENGKGIDSQLDWSATVITHVLVDYGEEAENRGNFYDRTNSYVAMRTELESGEYYGWLRVSHSAEEEVLTVHDWAWNTTAGDPILAGQIPEPATYVMLVGLGALGFVVFRKRRGNANG